MEQCPTLEQLRLWRAGRLSQADRAAIETHVGRCSQCQPLLDDLLPLDDDAQAAASPGGWLNEPTAPLGGDHATPSNAPAPAGSARAQRFGRFEIVELLGKGAFGAVYRARDPKLGRVVALKIPRKGLLQDREERERFLREARAAATLHHPNICPVHDAGELDGRQYIVMALIDGQPLAKIIARGKPLAERSAATIVRKLALALDEAHRQGIVHRDIKPSNIMIDRRGQPVVMDFGLARYDANEATLTESGAVLGTPAYMAPEQALSRLDEIGPATDVYALGVVLYEMLTARRPFEGDKAAVLGQIAAVEPRPPSALRAGLDPKLDAICLKAIAKQTSARYGSMREFAEALREYLKAADASQAGNLPALDAPEFANLVSGLNTQLATIAKRQRVAWWKWAVAAGAVVFLVLLGLLLVPRGPLVVTNIGIDPRLLADASLSFFLDDREITARQAREPMDLAAGDHELKVMRAETLIKHYRFHVSLPPDSAETAGALPAQAVELREVKEVVVVKPPQPAAHWDFDDAPGGTVVDVQNVDAKNSDAKNMPPATPQPGGVRSQPGVRGLAASFSGSGDAIVIPDDPRFHSNTAFTIAAWVCPKSDRTARIAGRWSEKNAFLLSWGEGLYYFSVAFPVGGPNGTSVGIQAFGATQSWAMITGVYDGKRLRLYVDGQLANSQPLTRSAALRKTPEFARDGVISTAVQESSGPFELGANGFDGLIDEVKFWDSALTDEQVAATFAAYDPPSPPSFADFKLLVPAYFYPAGEGQKDWDRVIASASIVSVVAIANVSSGPGDAADPSYAAVIRQCKKAGVRVIGYVSTSYGNRDVGEVTADIDRWFRFYPEIGGFFFDEQASSADLVDRYAELYRYAKDKVREGLIVGNPGGACDRGFFERPAADVICVFENKTGLHGFQPPIELNRVSPGSLAALLYDVPNSEQMQTELQHAAAHGIEYLYLTDDAGSNPWDRLPSYWQEEVTAMHAQ